MNKKFQIPKIEPPDDKKMIAQVVDIVLASRPQKGEQSPEGDRIPSSVVKGIAAIATNAWKARLRMVDKESGEPREEMARVYGDVSRILKSLESMSVKVEDHTGVAFDIGMPQKVVTTEPTVGITKELVTETLKPTIYWQNQIIQMGEVIIATPA